MAKRTPLTNSGSSRLFAATSARAHMLNNPKLHPMRGGKRL
jgi:hypothetical protein